MRPKNFPGRKYQRQMAAAHRAAGHKKVRARDITVPGRFLAIRTKKDRSGRARIRAA